MSGPKIVEPADPAKKTSDITKALSDETTAQMEQDNQNCFWNDEIFSQGEQISVDGQCYECSFGHWVTIQE